MNCSPFEKKEQKFDNFNVFLLIVGNSTINVNILSAEYEVSLFSDKKFTMHKVYSVKVEDDYNLCIQLKTTPP